MQKSDLKFYNPDKAAKENRNRILAIHEKRPQVAAFVTVLFDTPLLDRQLDSDALVAYSTAYADLVEMSAVGLDALIENRGTRTDFLSFVTRLLSAFVSLNRAAMQSDSKRSWRFPPKIAAVLREIGESLRQNQCLCVM